MFRAFFLLGLALCVAGCDQAEISKPPAPPASASPKTFQVKGVVLEVKPEEKTVKIKHEEVPGYMPAMTMPFEVRDVAELSGLDAGDPVSFRLLVTDTDGWIDQIRKTGPRTNILPAAVGPLRVVREIEPLNIGDRLPEYHFTNQLGRPFSTTQFKGQVLAINFIFTRCPFAPMCPQTARYFEETQKKLLASPNAPANWHMLTITFDPEYDTPTVLKAYADLYHADPLRWSFATGTLADITDIGQQVGLTFWRDETGSITHNLRTLVIDPSGRIQKNISGNDWTPDELVAEIVKAAAAK